MRGSGPNRQISRRGILAGSALIALGGLVGAKSIADGSDTSLEATSQCTSPATTSSRTGAPGGQARSTSQEPPSVVTPQPEIAKGMPISIRFEDKRFGGPRGFVVIGLTSEGGIGDPEGRQNRDKFGIYVAPKYGPVIGEGRRVITTGHTYEDGSGAYPPDAKDIIAVGSRFHVKTDTCQTIEYVVTSKVVVKEEDYSAYVRKNDLYGYNSPDAGESMVGITCTDYDPGVRDHTSRLIFIARALGVVDGA